MKALSKAFLIVNLSLELLACSKSNVPPAPNYQSLWSPDQVTAIQQQCSSVLGGQSIDPSKIGPICDCWVHDVTTSYSPDAADSNANVDPIKSLLNACGTANGLTAPLALFAREFRQLFAPLRAPQSSPDEKKTHIPSAISQVLDRVRHNPNAGGPEATLVAALRAPIADYLARPADYHLHLFRSPISVENLRTDSNYPKELEILERISEPGSATFTPMPKTVNERLHFLADKIEAGKPISEDLKKRYEEALAYLYSDVAKRVASPNHLAYLRYLKAEKEIYERLHNASDSRERELLQLQLDRLRSDYLGFREEFDKTRAYLLIKEQVEREKDLVNPEAVRASLLRNHQPQFQYGLESAVRGQSGWITFQSPISASGGLSIDGRPIDSHVSRVRGNLLTVDLDWPTLHDPVIRNGRWRARDQWVLSEGAGATESPKALLPRINSSVVLAEKLELSFASPATVGAIESALRSGKRVVVSGIELSASRVERTGPRSIRVNATQVIAVYDHSNERMPKR